MGKTQSIRSRRKDEHIELAEKYYSVRRPSDFDQMHLIRPTLPESRVTDVDLTTTLFGHKLSAPLYINAMTGGSDKSKGINAQLATIAAKLNIGMATGSASILVQEPAWSSSFTIVRENDPTGLVFTNINPNVTPAEANEIVDLLKADALQIHVNAIQEAVMPEGDRDFVWLDKIAALAKKAKVPVIVKEVGFGFDQDSLEKLKEIGVKYVDVAGFGGTNFVDIENSRRKDFDMSYLSEIGLSAVKSLLAAKKVGITAFASGGIRNPLDMLKCLVLGGKAIGISGLVLHQLVDYGPEKAADFVERLIGQLRLVLALYGLSKPYEAVRLKAYYNGDLKDFIKQQSLE